MGAPIWGPQEIVQASVLCPGHEGSHMGTPGVPPQSCVQAMGATGLIFPQKFWDGNHHPSCGCTQKGGWLGAAPCGCRIWGQHPSPSQQSHPMWLWGEKWGFRGNPSFTNVQLASMTVGWAHSPVGCRGLMTVPAPLQGLGCLRWHHPPRSAVVLSPITTSQCHALSLKNAAKWSGKAPGRALGGIQPLELIIHHHATKGFVKRNPKNPLLNTVGIKRRRTN